MFANWLMGRYSRLEDFRLSLKDSCIGNKVILDIICLINFSSHRSSISECRLGYSQSPTFHFVCFISFRLNISTRGNMRSSHRPKQKAKVTKCQIPNKITTKLDCCLGLISSSTIDCHETPAARIMLHIAYRSCRLCHFYICIHLHSANNRRDSTSDLQIYRFHLYVKSRLDLPPLRPSLTAPCCCWWWWWWPLWSELATVQNSVNDEQCEMTTVTVGYQQNDLPCNHYRK